MRRQNQRSGPSNACPRFVLKEHLGHRWTNERVTFDVRGRGMLPRTPFCVIDQRGRHYPAQAVRRNGRSAVTFVVDELAPYSTRTFTLTADESVNQPRVTIAEEDGCWVVDNGKTAIRMPRLGCTAGGKTLSLERVDAPLGGLRLASGRWTARGVLEGMLRVRSVKRWLVEYGPVVVTACHRYEFDEGFWEIELSLTAGQPAIQVTETLNTGPTLKQAPVFRIHFDGGFSPTHAVAWLPWFLPPRRPEVRRGYLGDHYRIPYRDGLEVSVIGHLPWWENTCRAFLMHQADPQGDALAFFPIRIGDWRSPMGCYFHTRSNPRDLWLELDLNLRLGRTGDGGDRRKIEAAEYARQFGFRCDWPKHAARRRWAMVPLVTGSAVRDRTVPYRNGEPDGNFSLLNPSALDSTFAASIARHSCVPLDKIKDWVLEWRDSRAVDHPRLFLRRAEVRRLRARVRKDPELARLLELAAKQNPIVEHLAKGGRATAQKLLYAPPRRAVMSTQLSSNSCQPAVLRYDRPASLVDGGLFPQIQANVELFLTVGYMGPGGYCNPWTAAPNSSRCTELLAKLDAAMGADTITSPERTRLRAMAAFFANVLFDQDWNPTMQGFHRGTINMPPRQEFALCIAASLLPTHPDAKRWLRRGIREFERQIGEYILPSGAAVENPHYNHEAVFATTFGGAIPLKVGGLFDLFRDDRIKRNLRFLVNLLTPRDPRFDAMMMPPWGNGSHEMVYLFGWLAKLTCDTDPEFSRLMQWAWKAQGCPQSHESYSKQWFGPLIADPSLPAKQPDLQSCAYDGFGVVMRSGFPSPDHTWLTWLQCRDPQHYNLGEMGAFMLYSKGAPLVMQQSGLYERTPVGAWWHSRIALDHKTEWHETGGRIEATAFLPDADFAQGVQIMDEYMRVPENPLDWGPPNQVRQSYPLPRTEWRRRIILLKDPDPFGIQYVVLRDDFSAARALPSEWNLWTMMKSVVFDGNRARMKGGMGVDLDVCLVNPSRNPRWSVHEDTTSMLDLLALARFRKTHPGQEWRERRLGIRAHQLPGSPFCAVLSPHLQREPVAQISSQADGRVVIVDHPKGRDHVLSAPRLFQWSAENLKFRGQDGVIRQFKDGRRVLVLLRPGNLHAEGTELVSDRPVQLTRRADGTICGRVSGKDGRPPSIRANGRRVRVDRTGGFTLVSRADIRVIISRG
jgi:hypothetical protein